MLQPTLSRRPFTLLELLVASAAAAVLMAALLAALAGAWRLQERGQEREEIDAPREAALRRLGDELLLAVPPAGVLAGPLTATTEAVGQWRHDDVEWVTAVGARRPEDTRSDLVKVHYWLSVSPTDADRYRLVRTENRDLLAVEEEEPDEVVVLDDVVSFSATWYDGETWQDSWDSTVQENALPEAVWLRVQFAERDDQQPAPLELIVPFAMHTPATTTTSSSSGTSTGGAADGGSTTGSGGTSSGGTGTGTGAVMSFGGTSGRVSWGGSLR